MAMLHDSRYDNNLFIAGLHQLQVPTDSMQSRRVYKQPGRVPQYFPATSNPRSLSDSHCAG